MPKPQTIREILDRLRGAGLEPQYDSLPAGDEIDWQALPPGVGPRWGGLPDGRLQRKRRQLDSLYAAARTLASPTAHILDFGSSSGHVGLPLAHLLPGCRVTLLDMKPIPLDIARRRIAEAQLGNVTTVCGEVAQFAEPFDLGIGLHVCGDGTDQALEQCLRHRAAYVFCPCDLGELQRSPMTYPRSKRFADVIEREDYNRLARAGDWTSWDLEDERCQMAYEVSGWLALDRNLRAEELGYCTRLYKVDPAEAGLKSVILAGAPEGERRMIETDAATAIAFLRADRLRYLAALASLSQNVPPIPRRVFADADPPTVLMLLEEFPHGAWASFTALNDTFLAECLDWLRARHPEFSVGSGDPRVLAAPALVNTFDVGAVACTRSFACTSLDRVPEPAWPVRVLTASDSDAMARYEYEDDGRGPGLPQMFQWLVAERRGVIYAITQGDDIVAHLSCSREFEDVWDVDYIHVQPAWRRRGLGTALAAAYARDRTGHGDVAYYSGVAEDNEASRRTAVTVGFACCVRYHSATVKTRETN